MKTKTSGLFLAVQRIHFNWIHHTLKQKLKFQRPGLHVLVMNKFVFVLQDKSPLFHLLILVAI